MFLFMTFYLLVIAETAAELPLMYTAVYNGCLTGE